MVSIVTELFLFPVSDSCISNHGNSKYRLIQILTELATLLGELTVGLLLVLVTAEGLVMGELVTRGLVTGGLVTDEGLDTAGGLTG